MPSLTSGTNEGNSLSLSGQLRKARALLTKGNENQEPVAPAQGEIQGQVQNPLIQALEMFEKLQEEIQRASIFSKNESLADVQTSSLSLMSVEYHMAKACLQLRTFSSISRNTNVNRALELFQLFLHRCDSLEGTLENTATQQYQQYLSQTEETEESSEFDSSGMSGGAKSGRSLPPNSSRDEKIARFRRSKEIKDQIARMNAQLAQRKRLGLEDHEDLDGHDQDSLFRKLYIHELNEFAFNAIEELYSCLLEKQMLQMAVKMERDREVMGRHRQSQDGSDSKDNTGPGRMSHPDRPAINDPNRRMKMTQVTQDPTTGQLRFKKQEVQSTLFRPSWNQPTMSLEELARKEVKDAMDREAKQKVSEANAKDAPRRYEYLVQDGMEDDADLVDASAKLDRDWDDWKAENPKGSGNKMGDVGDRNF